jgi:hypothetical protein
MKPAWNSKTKLVKAESSRMIICAPTEYINRILNKDQPLTARLTTLDQNKQGSFTPLRCSSTTDQHLSRASSSKNISDQKARDFHLYEKTFGESKETSSAIFDSFYAISKSNAVTY